MSAPVHCPSDPFERYGLRLVEEPARAEPARAEPHALPMPRTSRPHSALGRLQWVLLIGLSAIQLAYLFGLVQVARWALHHLTRS